MKYIIVENIDGLDTPAENEKRMSSRDLQNTSRGAQMSTKSETEDITTELLWSEARKYESLVKTYLYVCRLKHIEPDFEKVKIWNESHDNAINMLIAKGEI